MVGYIILANDLRDMDDIYYNNTMFDGYVMLEQSSSIFCNRQPITNFCIVTIDNGVVIVVYQYRYHDMLQYLFGNEYW